MNPSSAEVLCQALQSAGIDHVFSLPGTQTTKMFEALRTSKLRTVVATNELSAAMMANGYFRATGKPAALLTIPGPGFTWALSGLAEAALDSAALLHITCAPATSPGRMFQLQAIDQTAIATPLTKRVFAVERADDVAAAIVAAHAECLSGEPGPVLVQVAKSAWRDSVSGPSGKIQAREAAATTESADVTAALSAIVAARRCMLLLGQGCHGAAELAAHLAERLNAVVVTTTSGRGAIPEDHPLSLGFALGANRSDTLNALIEACDLVLAIGCKFSHNGSRGFRLRVPPEKLIHVDASHRVLGANYPARLAICTDARAFLDGLLRHAAGATLQGFTPAEIAQWRERCRIENERDHLEPRIHGVPSGKPQAFFAALRRALPRESHLVTDSGQHQDLARRHFPVWCPRGLITPTNLQSMGFGIGAAIGAKLAVPQRAVVALIGDGGLAMSGLELLTAVREKLDLTVIVFADGAYGAIRDQQVTNYGHTYGTDLPALDCAELAKAVGATYVPLDRDAEATLRSAIASKGVKLVEVAIGDSMPMHVRHAKAIARATIGRSLRKWVRERRQTQ